MDASIVYRHKSALYVNLTNRCSTACAFCVKTLWKMDYRGRNLDLAGAEPSPEQVISLAKQEWAKAPFDEFVFCGYGEPTMRLPEMLACARAIKTGAAAPIPASMRVRLNTNGLSDAVWGRSTAPEMKGLIDAVHVSLNTSDPAQWAALMRPLKPWADGGFEKVKDFIRAAVRVIPEVRATALEGGGVDAGAFKALAGELGALPRFRGRLESGACAPAKRTAS